MGDLLQAWAEAPSVEAEARMRQEYLRTLLAPAVEQYIREPSRENLNAVHGRLIDAAEIIRTPPERAALLQNMFDQVFARYHALYLQEARREGVGRTIRARERQRAIEKVLRLPSVVFSDMTQGWSRLIAPIGLVGLERAPREKRPRLRGEDAVGFTVSKTAEQEAAQQAKAKRKKEEEEEEARREEAMEEQLRAEGRGEEVYAFRAQEQLSAKKLTRADPRWMLDGPGGSSTLEELVRRAGRRWGGYEASTRDAMIVKNETRFWIEEFFATLIEPCNFAAPTTLLFGEQYNDTYRRRLMYHLLKLSHGAGSDPVVWQTPLLTRAQWREYLTMMYPIEGGAYFGEINAPVDRSVLEALRAIEDTWVSG